MLNTLLAVLAAQDKYDPAILENGQFKFTLTTAANTSAGIYNQDGQLIRTLWSGKKYEAGTHTEQWDGLLDDYITPAPFSTTYNIRILINNVKYTWEGVIGNTSSSLTTNVFKSYGGITCLAFAGTNGFYGHFFYEGGTNSKYFNTTDIGKSYGVNVGVHAITIDCATDGNIIVWACADQYQNGGIDGNQTNYLFASKVSDNSAVSFTNQSSHASGRENEQYDHFIGWFADKVVGGTSYSGVAVNANFIFATKSSVNQLLIFDKVTGDIVQALTYTNPQKLAAGSSNELWMIADGSVAKYAVNPATGALTNTSIIITANNPACVRVSPDNSTVLITDIGTHQVKAYSNSTGTLLWTLGQEGGYDTNGPVVTKDKFMFNRVDFASPAIAYGTDGSFWVNDVGNYRALHFAADHTYIEEIMYMPSSRSTNADPNNPTRVFCDELEFQRYYNKPLDNGKNGSWKLVNNWKVGTSLDVFGRFVQAFSLSNGHKYGGSGSYLYDLLPTGAVGVCNYDGHIEADGSLWRRLNYYNDHFEVRKRSLTGFTTLPSGAQVPNWGEESVVVTTPSIEPSSPFWYIDNTRGAVTNPNRYIFFQPNYDVNLGGPNLGVGYHLGSIKTGGNTFEWEASKSTFSEYRGDYPRNGDFDTSNQAGHSENCQALVNGSDIFWNVNGEFWRANSIGGGEINIWNHFNEDGLFIGNFGKTGIDAALTGNTEFAGNAFSTALVKVSDDIYIYHCDENQHGGVHSWHVTGLETINEQTVPITVSTTIVPALDPSNLMIGLPYRSTTFTGGNGFSVSYPSGLMLTTNKLQYQKENTDIALGKDASDGNGNTLILKSLNNTSALTSWHLSAGISYQDSELTFGNAPDGSDNFNYLEVIDQSGKIIARFIGNQADTRNNYYLRVWFNNSIVAEGSDVSGINFYYFKDISLIFLNGNLTFKHEDYPAVTVTTPFESGADMSSPANLRVNQGGNRTRYINMYKLRFMPINT